MAPGYSHVSERRKESDQLRIVGICRYLCARVHLFLSERRMKLGGCVDVKQGGLWVSNKRGKSGGDG